MSPAGGGGGDKQMGEHSWLLEVGQPRNSHNPGRNLRLEAQQCSQYLDKEMEGELAVVVGIAAVHHHPSQTDQGIVWFKPPST